MILLFAIPLFFIYLFFKSPYFLIVDNWVKQNTFVYVLSLFIYKIIGVLFPPIPAGLVTMASIPFLGWFNAYLVDLLGSMVGGTLAYFLARRYGHPILVKMLGEEIASKAEKMKIKKGKEIEAVFMYRVVLGTVILEAIYYGAGFLRVSFKNFFVGAFLSHVFMGVPIFYLTNNIFNGQNLILTILISVFGLFFMFFTKGRYFE